MILDLLTSDGILPQHLDSSPNQYIQWRYGIGEDREALEKVNLKTNDDEEKKMAEKQVWTNLHTGCHLSPSELVSQLVPSWRSSHCLVAVLTPIAPRTAVGKK